MEENDFERLFLWASTLSKSEIDFLCDGGWYNKAIKGYLIQAAREVNFSHEEINRLCDGLREALEFCSKEDVEVLAENWKR